jgi:hypothetical protein
MPFVAKQEAGERSNYFEFVVPEEVSDGETVLCLECDGRMRPRSGGGERARHFLHVEALGSESTGESATSCDGAGEALGESARHRKWKSLAVSGLRKRFGDADIGQHGLEHTIDVSDGPSLYEERRADALLEFAGNPFPTSNTFFGQGVILEVQVHNEQKDVAAVTADYLMAGYSVYWAHEEDFASDRFRLERFERAFNERWPTAFAPYFIDADTALTSTQSVEFDPEELSDGWRFVDPRPDCSHSFHPVNHGIPFCMDCGTEVTEHETGRTMYRPIGAR